MPITLELWHVLVGTGSAGAVGTLAAIGFASRYLQPMMQGTIETHEGRATTVDARRAQIVAVIREQASLEDGAIRQHAADRHEGVLSKIETVALEQRKLSEYVRDELGAVREATARVEGALSSLVERSAPARPAYPSPLRGNSHHDQSAKR